MRIYFSDFIQFAKGEMNVKFDSMFMQEICIEISEILLLHDGHLHSTSLGSWTDTHFIFMIIEEQFLRSRPFIKYCDPALK